MRVHYLQHEADENPGSIDHWIQKNGHSLSRNRMFNNEEFPSLDEFDLLIVPGGYMNVDEENKHPWLKAEKRFLKSVIDSHKKVVGICLGAQLIADVLGAKVSRCKEKEIGWYPVRLNAAGSSSYIFKEVPEEFLTLHWHEYCFELPEGAIHLAGSEASPNQVFIWQDHVLALQFHLEFTPEIVKNMLNDLPDKENQRFVQSASEIHCVSPQQFERSNRLLDRILDNFTSD